MKTTFGRLMIAAAALTVVAGAASAQTLEANISFPFRAGNRIMPAGSYKVYVKDVDTMVILSNFDARESVALLPWKGDRSKKRTADSAPVLTFQCGVSRCELVRLYKGGESDELSFPHRSLGKDEQASLKTVRLVSAAD